MTVRPIALMNRRMPEAGRIRLGVKSGNAMRSIDTFRLTSPNPDLIAAAAAQFGAKVGPRPWDDPKASPRNQHEVITTTSRLRVFLPPDALSVWYEMWSGGGCQRRCDGEVCQVAVTHGQEQTIDEVPCLCAGEKVMRCRPHTRLSVVLPDLAFAGVWRLETHGWNAMQELAGMEAAITLLQANVGMVEAELSLQQRQAQGGAKKFVVPVLGITSSATELIAGMADVRTVAALQATTEATKELTTGAAAADWFDDDEVADAEIVDEPAAKPDPHDWRAPLLISFSEIASRDNKRDEAEVGAALCRLASRGRKTDLLDLTQRQRAWLVDVLEAIENGTSRWAGIDSDGVAVVEEA